MRLPRLSYAVYNVVSRDNEKTERFCAIMEEEVQGVGTDSR